MTSDLNNRITTPFPTPPGEMLHALELLNILRRGDADEMARAGDLTDLPRPWEPATCPNDLREEIWRWCDQVVAWLNHEYAWRPTQMIPICWLQHPHIARELPVLAILRWTAEESTAPEPMEEWQRYAFPMFWERMTSRLGENTCRANKHQDWPADGRHTAYLDSNASQERQDVILSETRPVTRLRVDPRA